MAKQQEIKHSETRTIRRSQITLNPYNPKRHTDRQIKEQVKNIKRNGYLGGIVWNSRSGNLLDGHRRVQALDIINKYDGTPDTDYQLKVEVVDFDRKTELEQLTYMAVGNSKADYNLVAQYASEIDLTTVGLSDDDLAALNALYKSEEYTAMLAQTSGDSNRTAGQGNTGAIQDLGSDFLAPMHDIERDTKTNDQIEQERAEKPQMDVSTVKDAKKAQMERAANHHSNFQETILLRFNSEDDYEEFCSAIGEFARPNLILDGTELLDRLTG